jgi:hypothetical protein
MLTKGRYNALLRDGTIEMSGREKSEFAPIGSIKASEHE